jgi:hypothetical protein
MSARAFFDRYGAWRGPYEEGTLFFYLDEYAKDSRRATCWRCSTATGTLADTAGAEKALHAGGKEHRRTGQTAAAEQGRTCACCCTARWHVTSATCAACWSSSRSAMPPKPMRRWPKWLASSADEVGDALRAGSRLERIGLVENLISEHNITDLADLMKVSEKLPPVLMREYRDQSELMAVFTRPAARSALAPGDFGFIAEDVQVLVRLLQKAVADKAVGVNVLLYGPPGTGKTELAKVVAQAAGVELFEVEYADRDGNSLSGRDRYPLHADRAGLPQGHAAGCAAVRRGRGRVSAGQRGRGRPDGAPRATGAGRRSEPLGQRQGLGEPDPRIEPRSHDLGHQPHRADRPGVSPPLCLPPGAQVAAAGRARATGAQDAGRRGRQRGLRRPP